MRKTGPVSGAVSEDYSFLGEYPHLKYQLASTYWYLGSAYLETGQKERAVEAFKSCLEVGQGLRDPDKFPMKDARKCIEKHYPNVLSPQRYRLPKGVSSRSASGAPAITQSLTGDLAVIIGMMSSIRRSSFGRRRHHT
jgi:hypothetical protein